MFWLKIFGPLAILAMIGGYIWSLQTKAAKWEGRVYAIADVVQEVGQFKGQSKGKRAGKLAYKDIAPGIRKIGTQRDQYLQSLNNHKAALLDQTRHVLALSAETQRLKALSAQQVALARQLTVQRNAAIQRAERAATRTQRLSADQEARDCELAMSALYDAGF